MNKLLSVMLLGATVGLTACGGDSDSSGSSNNEIIPAKFQGLPNCVVDEDSFEINQKHFIINESNNDSPTCLAKVPNLNNGRTFALACGYDRRDETVVLYSEVSEDGKGNLQSIVDDIRKYIDYLEDDNANTSTSKYGYYCEPNRPV